MLIFGNIGNVVSTQKQVTFFHQRSHHLPRSWSVFSVLSLLSPRLMPRGLEKCFLGSVGQAGDNPLGVFSELSLVTREN